MQAFFLLLLSFFLSFHFFCLFGGGSGRQRAVFVLDNNEVF